MKQNNLVQGKKKILNLRDISLWTLFFANLFVLYKLIFGGFGSDYILILILIYAIQTLIIGFFGIFKIAFRKKGKYKQRISKILMSEAGAFSLILIFTSTPGSFKSDYLEIMLLSSFVFLAHHLFSFIYNWKKDISKKRFKNFEVFILKRQYMMWLPFAFGLIIGLIAVIFLGPTQSSEQDLLWQKNIAILGMVFKIFFDLKYHNKEHLI